MFGVLSCFLKFGKVEVKIKPEIRSHRESAKSDKKYLKGARRPSSLASLKFNRSRELLTISRQLATDDVHTTIGNMALQMVSRMASRSPMLSKSIVLGSPFATLPLILGEASSPTILGPDVRHKPNTIQARTYRTSATLRAPNSGLMGINNSNIPSTYFQRPSLPANTIIRFVPQQTAWVVERMGKFNRILEPGLAILWPFLDRIAYVKSLKESAIEIPSQSAITADNVTLELDGVLYTRVFDAYKAR